MTNSEPFQSLADEFAAAWQSDLTQAQVRVAVMGPATKGRKNEDTQDARNLRMAILRECKDLAVAVKPEHRDLIAITHQHLGAAANLCNHEIELVQRTCDVIIIVAAGAGALVELGMFAERDWLRGKRVLILLDRKYRTRRSFINHGPRLAYRREKATVWDVDYSRDIEKVRDQVRRLLVDAKASKVTGRF
jgi:hypothetical protein